MTKKRKGKAIWTRSLKKKGGKVVKGTVPVRAKRPVKGVVR